MTLRGRLSLGLLKGILLGGVIGAGFQLGLRWHQTGVLLGYLIAMGNCATVAIVGGKPPWRTNGWLETALRAAVGLAFGAGSFWGLHTYASASLPFNTGAQSSFFFWLSDAPWTAQPILLLPIISMPLGALIELDNTPNSASPTHTPARGPKKSESSPSDVEDALWD